MVILIGAGIQMFMLFLKSFGFMAPVVTTVTSLKWVIASTAIMPAVAAQQVPAGTGASMWLVSCVVVSALMLGVIAVVNIVSHRYRHLLGPVHTELDHDEQSVAAVVPSARVVRPQARIRRRPAGASMMLMFGLLFKSCGASTIATPVAVASAHIDFSTCGFSAWFD